MLTSHFAEFIDAEDEEGDEDVVFSGVRAKEGREGVEHPPIKGEIKNENIEKSKSYLNCATSMNKSDNIRMDLTVSVSRFSGVSLSADSH